MQGVGSSGDLDGDVGDGELVLVLVGVVEGGVGEGASADEVAEGRLAGLDDAEDDDQGLLLEAVLEVASGDVLGDFPGAFVDDGLPVGGLLCEQLSDIVGGARAFEGVGLGAEVVEESGDGAESVAEVVLEVAEDGSGGVEAVLEGVEVVEYLAHAVGWWWCVWRQSWLRMAWLMASMALSRHLSLSCCRLSCLA